MKKTCLISLLLVFSFLFSFADNLWVDRVESATGYRVLRAKYTTLTSNVVSHKFVKFSLRCVVSQNDVKTYFLDIRFNETKGTVRISDGKKLLIKFEDGSTMALSNIGEADYEIAPSGGIYFDELTPAYSISQAEIEELISKKVVKIRIDNNSTYKDIDIKKNKFSQELKQMNDDINEALKVKKDVFSDF